MYGSLQAVCALLTAALLIALCAHSAPAADETPAPPDVPQAVAVKFLVKTSKQSYIVGEPILLDLMLQNNGTEELTLFVSDEVEKAVQVNFENQAELPVKKVVTVSQRGGLSSREVFFAPPNGAAHVYLILDRLALLEKPGVYKGAVTVKMENHEDFTAPILFAVVEPLEQIASSYYDAWSAAKGIDNRQMAVELLSYVHSNCAIKYLEKIVLEDNASDDDRMKAAEGFVHIGTKESATFPRPQIP